MVWVEVEEDEEGSKAWIAAIVVPIGVIIIGLIAWYCYRKKKGRTKRAESQMAETAGFIEEPLTTKTY
eukprot:CAMPEP_0201282438 /NCGR_PEP_ID=MMETSP1317-20130820/5644_1 /ASSEMBLY_ACC=CAM_ASM_000770 /TAXON_ID=187299 /ORGANISM="Undescribed Undescribed, Strain Undescribed" /LENGTH=67 /DNA_ID=CAMNT_0047595075 /DNA_START=400 /DNA_END=606 /DNA_ORIENTATION=+